MVRRFPGRTDVIPNNNTLATTPALRSVVSLGSDTSFDAQLTTVAMAAQDRVNSIVGYPVQGAVVKDYYPSWASHYELSHTPAHDAETKAVTGTFNFHAASWDTNLNSVQAWSAEVVDSISSGGDSITLQPQQLRCHVWDASGNAVIAYDSDRKPVVTNPQICFGWAETRVLPTEYQYPVWIQYSSPALSYAGPVQHALEQMVLVMFRARSGLDIGVPSTSLLRDVERTLAPLIDWNLRL